MPYSIVHLDLANKKVKSLNISKEKKLDFFVWNIIVDNSYNLNSYWIEKISRDDTHYHTNQNYMEVDFVNNFFTKEDINKNYLIYWYYYHLLVDKFWRDFEFEWRKLDEDIYKAYQISRKINSKIDLEKFLDKKIIVELYSYQIDIFKLPWVFQHISQEIMQKSYIDILDYMTFKKTFSKWDFDEKYEYFINKYFSYNHHLDMKDRAFNNIKI